MRPDRAILLQSGVGRRQLGSLSVGVVVECSGLPPAGSQHHGSMGVSPATNQR